MGKSEEAEALCDRIAVVDHGKVPATMLGCVYDPWSALHSIRWLQILVLIGGTGIFGYLGARTFRNRVVD